MPFLTRSPCKRDTDTHQGSREVRDLCCGRSSAVDPGQPGIPSHHGGENDACGECFEWDLLWVGPDDVVVIETKDVTMQVSSEP